MSRYDLQLQQKASKPGRITPRWSSDADGRAVLVHLKSASPAPETVGSLNTAAAAMRIRWRRVSASSLAMDRADAMPEKSCQLVPAAVNYTVSHGHPWASLNHQHFHISTPMLITPLVISFYHFMLLNIQFVSKPEATVDDYEFEKSQTLASVYTKITNHTLHCEHLSFARQHWNQWIYYSRAHWFSISPWTKETSMTLQEGVIASSICYCYLSILHRSRPLLRTPPPVP